MTPGKAKGRRSTAWDEGCFHRRHRGRQAIVFCCVSTLAIFEAPRDNELAGNADQGVVRMAAGSMKTAEPGAVGVVRLAYRSLRANSWNARRSRHLSPKECRFDAGRPHHVTASHLSFVQLSGEENFVVRCVSTVLAIDLASSTHCPSFHM